ncbi:hypothetical protein CA267_012085 [Alteromonas pelagimontana]|uniref:ATP-grasp domain-containing protein n=1 Tax=Alteromonas pelagimontana TaxID=1858656 RepID=A0A6M4MH01_9ALTE|nr:hypothetical protein [Alteromonas pelagimontana]QJR81466.1 hypothetical protein CA267_012085 [Alteromonas pelagimontana]
MNILLLGQHDDYQILHVAAALEAQRHTPIILDTRLYPSAIALSWEPTNANGTLAIADKNIRFNEIAAAYWHKFNPVSANTQLTSSQQAIASQDAASALNTLFYCPSIRWVNGVGAIRYHQSKPLQLNHVYRLGIPIPATYIGNSPLQSMSFFNEHDEVIIKPVHGGATAQLASRKHQSHAYLVKALALSPVTLQAYVSGADIRTYVFGDVTYSVEIYSQYTDYRDDPKVTAVIHETPRHVCAQAVAVCKALGMVWCAIDWRRDSNGCYYFLEANPCPYFVYIERTTGFPLTENLVRLLTATEEA